MSSSDGSIVILTRIPLRDLCQFMALVEAPQQITDREHPQKLLLSIHLPDPNTIPLIPAGWLLKNSRKNTSWRPIQDSFFLKGNFIIWRSYINTPTQKDRLEGNFLSGDDKSLGVEASPFDVPRWTALGGCGSSRGWCSKQKTPVYESGTRLKASRARARRQLA